MTEPAPDTTRTRTITGGFTRIALLVAGFVSLGLGLVGIIVPLLPTTPFILLACACFLRSSRRMYTWVHTNRVLGAYILNYEHHQMRRRDKIITITLLWISIAICLWLMPVLWPRILVIAIACGVTWHLTRLHSID